EGSDGTLYGATVATPSAGVTIGQLYRIDHAGNVTLLHTLTDAEGKFPQKLIQSLDGNLYGIASHGGQFGGGAIFQLALATGVVTRVASFPLTSGPSANGSGPVDFIETSDGNFHG